jgi:hypothetical protein
MWDILSLSKASAWHPQLGLHRQPRLTAAFADHEQRGSHPRDVDVRYVVSAASDAGPYASPFYSKSQKMKVVVYLVAVVIYLGALLYLLLSALGFSFGLRIGGNIYAEEGFGFQRATYLVLLVLLLCAGLYSVWRINRRSV